MPSAARCGPPDIGASIVAAPACARRAASRSTSPGAMVGHSITVWPAIPPGRACTPRSPHRTSSHCAASTTQTIVIGTSAEAAAAPAQAIAPRFRRFSTLMRSRSCTCTCQPRASRFVAMPPPMLPVPTIPTRRPVAAIEPGAVFMVCERPGQACIGAMSEQGQQTEWPWQAAAPEARLPGSTNRIGPAELAWVAEFSSCPLQQLCGLMQRQPHDAGVAAFDAPDEGCRLALDAVAAGFAEGLLAGDIGIDGRGRESLESYP